jgi:hypothetical protein
VTAQSLQMPASMSLRKCAPWIFDSGKHEVSASEAEAVKRLFASLSQADARAEAAKKESGNYLPLHYVAIRAQGRYSIEVFSAVLNAYPSAAKEKNSGGCLPLHFVARFMSAEGLRAIQLLLEEYPQAAKEKNSGGYLPIHLICWNENGATLEMVRELLSAYPQGITEQDSDNRTPYAFAAQLKNLPADAIDFLRRAEQGRSTNAVSPNTHTHTHTACMLCSCAPSSHSNTIFRYIFPCSSHCPSHSSDTSQLRTSLILFQAPFPSPNLPLSILCLASIEKFTSHSFPLFSFPVDPSIIPPFRSRGQPSGQYLSSSAFALSSFCP